MAQSMGSNSVETKQTRPKQYLSPLGEEIFLNRYAWKDASRNTATPFKATHEVRHPFKQRRPAPRETQVVQVSMEAEVSTSDTTSDQSPVSESGDGDDGGGDDGDADGEGEPPNQVVLYHTAIIINLPSTYACSAPNPPAPPLTFRTTVVEKLAKITVKIVVKLLMFLLLDMLLQ